MAASSSFNNHLVSVYDTYWNSVTNIRIILLDVDPLDPITPETDLATVLSLEIEAINGYTTGGQIIQSHTSTYDAIQLRAEGRPPSVSYTAAGGSITFNAWALLADKGGVQETCFFYIYERDQIIGDGNSLEITTKINLGTPFSDVIAPDI